LKSVDDPEFILLQKAREVKKRKGDPEAVDELIELAEGIINQNFKGALLYLMTATRYVEIKDLDKLIELIDIEKEKGSVE
jgi:hypothetical protein